MKRYSNSTIFTIVFLVILASSADAQVGRGKFGFGLSVAGTRLQSDLKTDDFGLGASADLSYVLGNNWALVAKVGVNNYNGKNTSNQSVLSTVFYGNVGVSYDFLPAKQIDPFLFGAVGLGFYTPRIDNGAALTSGKYQMWDMSVSGGVGLDYYIDESWSVIFAGQAGMLLNDQIDGYKAGDYNDIFGQVSIGIRYYLFDRSAVQRIVDKLIR